MKRTSSNSERENDTYQPRNILIYYCIFMIPIPNIHTNESISFLYWQPRTPIKFKLRMTITLERDNNVTIYGLEKLISFGPRTRQIFVAQCVW
jgi:hypothetical protein